MSASFSSQYARSLLKDLGWHSVAAPAMAEHPAIAWSRSLLMELTGEASGPALMCPAPLAAAADGAMMALAEITNATSLHTMRGATLLGQRARLMGLTRSGPTSPGGGCKLLQADDGWIAITLARQEDWACLPALLEHSSAASWDEASQLIARTKVADIIDRAHILGIGAARADRPPSAGPWFHASASMRRAISRSRVPVVLDLSTLWAGPLCGALLHRAGAFVIKFESTSRPDGARAGHGGFYDFLNAGKKSVAMDIRQKEAVAMLRRLMSQADIVIESSRPRALRQLGIGAEDILGENPALTWISITGHGRTPEMENRVAFGDDAAAAAGLCQIMDAAYRKMVFCGDAIADPLTGMHAAIAAWASWRDGGGRLISLSLSGVAAHCATQDVAENPVARAAKWAGIARSNRAPSLPLPDIWGKSRPMGADTNGILSMLDSGRIFRDGNQINKSGDKVA